MKKRKLAALGLALTLTLGTAFPALAAEAVSTRPAETGGSYLSWDEFLRQYMEEHPEHCEAFDAGAYFAEEYRWMEKEEYMDDMGLESEEAFKAAMWDEYLSSGVYSDQALYDEVDGAYGAYLINCYEGEHPGELAGLKTGDLLAWQGYTETLTPEEQYRRDWGLDSADPIRPSLLRTYAQNRLNVEMTHADFLVYQAAWPEQWTSFDADAWFAEEYDWTDKESYINSGNLRSEEEFRENMFVRYVEGNYWDWDVGYPTSPEGALTLVVNGSALSDAVLTAEKGVSYTDAATLNSLLGTSLTGDRVAIREAATAAGWDVVWNQSCNEVVLLDRARLTRGTVIRSSGWDGKPIEAYVKYDFSRLDELMDRLFAAAGTETGQSYRTTETVDLTFTAFNSLDGDEIYTARVTADALVRDGSVDMTLTADLSGLADVLSNEVRQAMTSEMPKYATQDLNGQLSALTMRILYTPKAGELFFCAPFLALLDDSVEEDAWYRMDLGGTVPATFAVPPRGGWDTGAILYESLLTSSGENYYGAEDAYTDWAASIGAVQTLFGAHAFTEENGTITWSLNKETMGSLLNSAAGFAGMTGASRLQGLFRELDVTLSVDKKGKVSSDAAFRLDMDALGALLAEEESWGEVAPEEIALYQWLMNLFDFRLAAHGEGTPDKAAASAQFHWKNQFKLEAESSVTRKAVRDLPLSAPPAGAEIVDL